MSNLILFPKHKFGMTLTHNPQLDYDMDVDEWDERYAEMKWVSDEQYWKAFYSNECWTLFWFGGEIESLNDPNFKVFHFAAHDLNALLNHCKDM
jgi:hypothetical protein